MTDLDEPEVVEGDKKYRKIKVFDRFTIIL